MNRDEFLSKVWKEFKETYGARPDRIPEKMLNEIIEYYAPKVFDVDNRENYFAFIKERENRNTDKVTKNAERISTIGLRLTWVAVILGVLQIVLAIPSCMSK